MWLGHFESVVKVNVWSDEDLAQWFISQLVGRTKVDKVTVIDMQY